MGVVSRMKRALTHPMPVCAALMMLGPVMATVVPGPVVPAVPARKYAAVIGLLLSTVYDSKAVANVRMSALVRATFARVCASRKLGTAIAARIAMIATTISNSMSVNAFDIDFTPHDNWDNEIRVKRPKAESVPKQIMGLFINSRIRLGLG